MRTDKELDYLENYIPELADGAFKKAYLDTLSKGGSVLMVEDEKLIEILPDGSKKVIKPIVKIYHIKQKTMALK